MISKRTRDHATKMALTAIAYWCVWIYLIAHGPMKKMEHGLFSADARVPLAFMVLGTLMLSIWTWRKYRQISGLLSGQIEANGGQPERSWTGAKWLGVLAWLAIGMFIMVFPALFLGATSLDPIFVGVGLLAAVIAVWVALTGDGKQRETDFTGIDIDLDP